MTVHDRPVLKLTVDDALAMASLGLFEDRRVELLDGVLTEMAAHLPPHAAPIRYLTRWLTPLLRSDRFDLSIQLPFFVPDPYSMPEPDVAVLPRVAPGEQPRQALLIVEVAYSSLRPDTTRKVQLYASAGVPDYWVVDVSAGQLQVRRDPGGEAYGSLEVFERSDRIAPLALDIEPLDLDELLRA